MAIKFRLIGLSEEFYNELKQQKETAGFKSFDLLLRKVYNVLEEVKSVPTPCQPN